MAEDLVTEEMLKSWDTVILIDHLAGILNAMNKELALHKQEIDRLHSLVSVLESRTSNATKRLDVVQGIR